MQHHCGLGHLVQLALTCSWSFLLRSLKFTLMDFVRLLISSKAYLLSACTFERQDNIAQYVKVTLCMKSEKLCNKLHMFSPALTSFIFLICFFYSKKGTYICILTLSFSLIESNIRCDWALTARWTGLSCHENNLTVKHYWPLSDGWYLSN